MRVKTVSTVFAFQIWGLGVTEGEIFRSYWGSRSSPKVIALIFILSVGFLFLLSAHPRDFVCGTSQSGVKSKRIALVAALQ